MILPSFTWADTNERFKIAVMPRPDPKFLAQNLSEIKAKGADVLVSMLQPHESAKLGLEGEAAACEEAGLAFYNLPVPDHDVPTDRDEAIALARTLLERHLIQGQGVVFHCFAGIGRSSTLAITCLILAGFELEDACRRLSTARGILVPETPGQVEWLRGLTVQGSDSP